MQIQRFDERAHTFCKKQALHFLQDNNLINKPLCEFNGEQVDEFLYTIWDNFVTMSQYTMVQKRKEFEKYAAEDDIPF